jgi:hypothetical protein
MPSLAVDVKASFDLQTGDFFFESYKNYIRPPAANFTLFPRDFALGCSARD